MDRRQRRARPRPGLPRGAARRPPSGSPRSPTPAAASSTPRRRWASPAPAASVDGDARDLVERTRVVTDLPVCVGLGVSTGAQAAELAGVRRRRHRRLGPRAHAERPRGTRRPARRVARTDDRAGRRSEDERDEHRDGRATAASPVDATRSRRRARARARRRRPRGRGSSSARCSSSRAPSRSATRSPPSARCRPTSCFPMEVAKWIGLALPFVEIVLGILLAARPVHPRRPRSSRPCSWWPSSSASRRPGPAG